MWDTHPEWLKPSSIPVTIVCGPPCSGKTTYVNKHKVAGDTVIDLDAICMKLKPGYRHWATARSDDQRAKLLSRAIKVRNQMLANLAKATKGRAWFVVSAPSQQERDWWQIKLGGYVVLLNPGLQECKRRAVTRGTPLAVAGVDAWEVSSEQPWRVRVQHHAIGTDGYPVSEA
jgi:hypothetical protein